MWIKLDHHCRIVANAIKTSKRSFSRDLSVPLSSYTSLLFKNAFHHLNNTAVINGLTGEQFRYSEMLNAIGNVSSGLWKMGICKNHVVSIVDYNSPEYLFAMHGIMETGAAVSYTNPASTEYELANQFKTSRPQMIITSSAFVEKVASAAKQADSVETILLFDGGSGPKDRSSSYLSFTKYLLEDNGSESRLFTKEIVVNPKSHVAQLPHSSGTTGLPKGVMLSHYNLCANIIQIQDATDMKHKHEVLMIVLPLFHIYAAAIQAKTFYTGNKVVTLPKFEPNTYLQAIDKYKVSYLHAVPPLVLFLIQSPLTEKYDLSSLMKVISAAAPLQKDIERQFLEKYRKRNANIDLFQGYGLSETSPISHLVPPLAKRLKNKEGSVGTLVSGMEFKVVDVDTGKTLGPHIPGELWMKGPNVMMGYYNNPKATYECLSEDGWFRTGDIVYYDEDEYFYIVDRFKELIKYKGIQVAPAELENVLLTHPSIKDAAVIGRLDERCGEVPVAFVVKKDENLSAENVKMFIADRLAEYKQLRGGVHFIEEIPKSASGKILRKNLRSLFYPRP